MTCSKDPCSTRSPPITASSGASRLPTGTWSGPGTWTLLPRRSSGTGRPRWGSPPRGPRPSFGRGSPADLNKGRCLNRRCRAGCPRCAPQPGCDRGVALVHRPDLDQRHHGPVLGPRRALQGRRLHEVLGRGDAGRRGDHVHRHEALIGDDVHVPRAGRQRGRHLPVFESRKRAHAPLAPAARPDGAVLGCAPAPDRAVHLPETPPRAPERPRPAG